MVRSSMMSIGAASGFHGRHAAGNLDAAATNFGADDRRGNDFALALFDEQDGHALVDVLAGHILEDAGAGGVQGQVDGGFLSLVVEAGLGIGQAVAGQHDLLFD
ncbi:MAG: hypothetical protein H6R13_1643 [Proteobacteria bacterium]|nr:hypothetical protein [Pseudomonadota bacterium]